MELFNNPANEFVAGFLGSPKMNFFDGVLVSANNDLGHFQGEEIDISGIRLVSADKTAGTAIRLGIRPQHLILDPTGPLRGTVTLIEQLGTETVLELVSSGETQFRFASPENLSVESGQQIAFRFEPQMAHLF